MKKWQIIIVVLIVIAVILGGSYAGIRNNMVRKKEQVNSAWSQVDVVIQRRADLIPNLVATVKGYAAHEEAVLGAGRSAGRSHPGGSHSGQWTTGRRTWPATGSGGELPAIESE